MKPISDCGLAALMAFGSHSRGDMTAGSDIDLLAVTDSFSPMIPVGRLNVHTYTWSTLARFCTQGQLFALHLRWDGTILADSSSRLRLLLDTAEPRKSYSEERTSCARILAAAPHFVEHTGKSAVVFAIRTIAFSLAVERGLRTFSKSVVISFLEDPYLNEIWPSRLNEGTWNVDGYTSTVSLFVERNVEALPDTWDMPPVTLVEHIKAAETAKDVLALSIFDRLITEQSIAY